MREIEIKAHVRDKEALIHKLEELGAVFGDAKTQHDVVYVKNSGTMENFLNNELFLRIRETAEDVTFTLKYHNDRTRNGKPGSMPIEHEMIVSSRTELEAMLALLGFVPAVVIKKSRQTAHHKNWEICLDEVDELGSFIEVEQLAEHDADVPEISTALTSFLLSLGIATEDVGVKRYDIQMLERGGGAI